MAAGALRYAANVSRLAPGIRDQIREVFVFLPPAGSRPAVPFSRFFPFLTPRLPVQLNLALNLDDRGGMPPSKHVKMGPSVKLLTVITLVTHHFTGAIVRLYIEIKYFRSIL